VSLLLYRALSTVLGPFANRYLMRRARSGKEDAARLGERHGETSRPRPSGRLVWIHAASVGESLSVMELVRRIIARDPEISVLMTTGTVTSARILDARLPDRAFHQYVPLDRATWVRRFLDHWRPDSVLWIESEFWPNMLLEIGRRKIPAVLVNARISPKSFAGWRRAPGTIRRLLGNFGLCLAQSQIDAERLSGLGATQVKCLGNLKFSSSPLPADDDALSMLNEIINGRPTWLAASTHPGEEPVIAAAHRIVEKTHPDALAIIVPRHPVRGPEIATELRQQGSAVGLRSAGETPASSTEFYVADSMGELGLFYRLARVAFVGGSLVPHGGQNLLEAANLGCPVIHGPHMHNFSAIVDEMTAAGATAEVAGADAIAAEVGRLLDDAHEHDSRASAARRIATTKAAILDAIVGEITPYIDASTGSDARREHARP